MTGNKWTFLVVSEDERPVRQITITRKTIQRAWIAGAALAVLFLGGLFSLGSDSVLRLRANNLEARNEALETELAQFQDRIASLESTLDRVAENDAHFRTIAGLETIDPEVLQAGVGGPGLGIPETSPLWATDSVTTKAVFATGYDLAALERRARLLSESLAEATDSALAHRELFESTPSILPTDGWMTSSFSKARMHPIHNRPLPHEGMDISAPEGTPVYAAAKGRVVRAGWAVGYGLTVEIDHGFGYSTLYGHNSKLIVQPGQEIARGDLIAQVGSTGISTASHLHYEVRVDGVPQDPARFVLPEAVRH